MTFEDVSFLSVDALITRVGLTKEQFGIIKYLGDNGHTSKSEGILISEVARANGLPRSTTMHLYSKLDGKIS